MLPVCYGNQVPDSLKYDIIYSTVNNMTCQTLVDSGSSKNYIRPDVVRDLGLKIIPKRNAKVILADSKVEHDLLGVCYTDVVGFSAIFRYNQKKSVKSFFLNDVG